MMFSRRAILGAVTTAISWALGSKSALASDPASTDLNLVIAVDCSYSVDSSEYDLQIAGIADVFADPDIARAIAQGPRGSMGVLLVQWSSRSEQIITLPWTRISSRQDVLDYAAAVAPQERMTAEAGTAISSILEFSDRQLNAAPFPADRRVIDLIADGKDNYREPVQPSRDAVVANQVTINALAIRNQVLDLNEYLYENVIGGSGAFVEDAVSYEHFRPAFKRKLLREINGRGLVGLPPAGHSSQRVKL